LTFWVGNHTMCISMLSIYLIDVVEYHTEHITGGGQLLHQHHTFRAPRTTASRHFTTTFGMKIISSNHRPISLRCTTSLVEFRVAWDSPVCTSMCSSEQASYGSRLSYLCQGKALSGDSASFDVEGSVWFELPHQL
jgi:hypothetical protein